MVQVEPSAQDKAVTSASDDIGALRAFVPLEERSSGDSSKDPELVKGSSGPVFEGNPSLVRVRDGFPKETGSFQNEPVCEYRVSGLDGNP